MPTELEEKSFLSRRLTIAIATPIALLLCLGILLGRQLLQLSRDAAWVDHTDQVVATAHETMLQIVDQETGLRGYLLTGQREFLEPFERAAPLAGFARLHALVFDNPVEQARFDEVSERYQEWLAYATKIADGAEAELSSGRSVEQMRRRKISMDGVRDGMKEALAAEEGLRKRRFEAAQASTQLTKMLFVGLLGAAALLLAFFSRRQLRSIAATFGQALEAEKEARREVADEAWVRAGHVKVSAAMQGELSSGEVAAAGLETLAKYLHADVGALFLRDGRHWRRRAGFAIHDEAGGPDSFGEREGIVGRAATTGEVIDLRDLPPDYLKVRSGTGEATPAEVLVVPARTDGVTHAVVEVGFLREAAPRTRALLARVGEVVAVAARSAAQKERLAELLEETQRQAEELQTQQEELRVQNEELEQQTKALHESRARMQNHQTELEQINTELEEQAQTLEQQRDDLARAQVELRRANAYKSEFLANMSHELRTPLNSSLILAKLLADNRDGNLSSEQIKFAQTIYSAGNDLLTLINDILDLSKIEAGKLDVRPETIAVARLVDDLTNTFRPMAQDKGLELSVQVENSAPASIYLDPTRLQQILKNLLSNALKFTDRGGVALAVRGEGRSIAFEVKDTGIGIAADQQEAIFEAFRQADGTTNRKYGGTGLGLSISRDLAKRLGGELRLDSAPGRGSTFTLVVPQHAPRDAATPAAPPVPAPRPPRPPAAPARPVDAPLVNDDRERLSAGSRAILLVEDDLPFARVLRDLAHELDFQVLVATTAEEGLAMARHYQPSAIVLDVGLPDRSGLSVLDVLKHDPATRHVPVHMVSVSDYTQTALGMGAAGYAIKPIRREQLVAVLRRLESKFTQKLRRVLVVEDDDVHRDSTCALLAADDVETVAVGTAAAALEQLAASTFDCMVLDLTLPDRTGFDLLEEMSRQDRYGFPPVIVYTGRSLSRDEEQQLRRYSQSIIIKGARSPERLLDEVTLFLHQVEAELPPERQRMLRDARNRDAVFEGRRILVVEDDVRNIFALSSVLEPRGAKVEIARNGREALAQLAQHPVDLVLMDVMMPEMDGLEATREIRKQPQHAKLPIIALTAKAMADDRDNCLAAGANDYIAKPLDVDKLLSLARVWMPK